jgi:hypothetical protein
MSYAVSQDYAGLVERVADFDDASLLWVMLSLLADDGSGRLVGGSTRNASMAARIVFGEVARRWVPSEALEEAFWMLDVDERPAVRLLDNEVT